MHLLLQAQKNRSSFLRFSGNSMFNSNKVSKLFELIVYLFIFFYHSYRFWTRYFLNQMISQLWLWLEILSIHFTFWISLSSSSLSPWLYLSCSFVFVSRSSSLFFSERFSGYTWNAFATSSLPLTHVGQVKLWFPFPSCFGVVPTRLIYLLWRDVHMHQLSICH